MKNNIDFNFKKINEQKTKILFKKDVIEILSSLSPDNVIIVADNKLLNTYVKKIQKRIQTHFKCCVLTMESKESRKDLKTLYKLSEEAVKNEATKNSVVVSIGGGIVGNMAGMLASLLFRGISLIHIPTTLLAQVDSAGDVKQSVNSSSKKNVLGVYYAPLAVIIDVDVLQTLSLREIRSGLAESIKHALAQDPSFLNFLFKKCTSEKIESSIVEQVIFRTLSLKIQHWQNTPNMWNDAPNKKPERLTHLGHTVGKAIEIIQKDKITHGEAISHGMIIESMCASKMDIGEETLPKTMKDIFEQFQLLCPLSDNVTVKAILKNLYGNKKHPNSPLFALLKEIGNSDTVSTEIPVEILKESLLEYGINK